MNNGLMSSTKNDERYTPEEAVKIILPYIPKGINTIWEPTAVPESQIVRILQNKYNVIATHLSNNEDFFETNMDCDMIITNPPYSKKDKFLERLFELDKPFMLLLPVTTLGSKARSAMFRNNPIQIIIPDRRFDFSGLNNNWFHTAWFCFKCNLKKDLNFININEHLSKSDLIQEYLAKNGNKYLDEILYDLRNILNIKNRSIKVYLKELGYEIRKRSKTEMVLMHILDYYKAKERLTVQVIINIYLRKVKSYDDILKLDITERTVFNFLKKYPYYKNLIKDYNNKIQTEIFVK